MELEAVEMTRFVQVLEVANTNEAVLVTAGVEVVATEAGKPDGAEA